jgi:hypothetical protein
VTSEARSELDRIEHVLTFAQSGDVLQGCAKHALSIAKALLGDKQPDLTVLLLDDKERRVVTKALTRTAHPTVGESVSEAEVARELLGTLAPQAPRPCDVVNGGCLAPPGFTDSHTRATCFACGLPVCTECSRVRRWYRYGRRRICRSCETEAS